MDLAKPPSSKKLHDAAYALCELGIAERSDLVLWEESKAQALIEVPSAQRRAGSGEAIWTTREVQVAIKLYEGAGGRYTMSSSRSSLLQTLVGKLPKSGILGTSAKMEKSESVNVLSRVVYLAPAWESGIITCPYHGLCGKYCIGHSSGRMTMDPQRRNRLTKTLLWHLYPAWFLWKCQLEAMNLVAESTGRGMVPAVRMNGSSDIRWEQHGLMQSVPSVTWYDYTKIPLNKRGDAGQLPANYHLTFSLDEKPTSWSCAMKYLAAGHNVAMVVGASWKGTDKAAKEAQAALLARGFIGDYPVISGDSHDARFMDVSGHWIALYAKGLGARDSEGFVYRFDEEGRLVKPRAALGMANRRRRYRS